MTASDLALDYLEAGEWEGAEEGWWRNRLKQLARLRLVAQLIMQSPTMPALPPPPPPPVVQRDRRSASRPIQLPRGKEGARLTHLAHLAESAESDQAADEAIAAMLPVLVRLAGTAARPAVRRAAPVVRDALGSAVRLARKSPIARPLVRTMPAIVSGTAQRMRQAARRGNPLSSSVVTRALLAEVQRILGSSAATRMAVRAASRPCLQCRRAADPRGHQLTAGAAAVPASRLALRSVRPGTRAARAVGSAGARPCGCRHYGA